MNKPQLTDFKKPDQSYRGKRIDEQDIVQDINRVGRVLQKAPSLSEYREWGRYSETAVYNRFDEWVNALKEAGWEINGQERGQYTEQELIKKIQKIGSGVDYTPTSTEFSERTGISRQTIYNHFGSWAEALSRAGYSTDRMGEYSPGNGRVEVGELIDEMCRVAECVDRPPTMQEMNEFGQIQSYKYVNAFGSWPEALRTCGFPPRYRGGSQVPPDSVENEYGANWQVARESTLERDKYECQHCGKKWNDHYAEKGAGLEVHHIVKARLFTEKENANHPQNLITLCEKCHRKWEPLSGDGIDVQELESEIVEEGFQYSTDSTHADNSKENRNVNE